MSGVKYGSSIPVGAIKANNRAPLNQIITCKSSKLLVGSIVGSEGDRLYGLFQTAYWPLGLCCLPFVGCHFFATCLLCRVHDLAQCGDDVDHGGDDDDDGDDGDDDDSDDGGDEDIKVSMERRRR